MCIRDYIVLPTMVENLQGKSALWAHVTSTSPAVARPTELALFSTSVFSYLLGLCCLQRECTVLQELETQAKSSRQGKTPKNAIIRPSICISADGSWRVGEGYCCESVND
jgi:hypothetical protein